MARIVIKDPEPRPVTGVWISIGKYLVAKEADNPGRKTRRWEVCSVRPERNRLGKVFWYPAWRQYVFQPGTNTIYNKGCMDDLAAFLEQKNDEHRVARKAARQAAGGAGGRPTTGLGLR